MLALVVGGFCVLALSAVVFKFPRGPAPPPEQFGVAASTSAGLMLRNVSCKQDGGGVVASGYVYSVDAQSPSITVTLNGLRMDGTRASTTATYPSSLETGSSELPFRLSVIVGHDIAYVCDVEVGWGDHTS